MAHTKRTRVGHQGWHEAQVGICARCESNALSPSAVSDEDRPSYADTEYAAGLEPQANFLPRWYVCPRADDGVGGFIVSSGSCRFQLLG